MTHTLDGKRAGLQKASDLKDELNTLKRKERDMFNRLGSEVSGRDAETKVRGRLKEKEEEERKKAEANEINDEVKQKYSRWSKGVKQAQQIQARIEEDLHTMSKPLARAADDGDLDAHLREQERVEDPMLEYMRKKKAKKAAAGKPRKCSHCFLSTYLNFVNVRAMRYFLFVAG